MAIPRFKSIYLVRVIENKGVLLISEDQEVLLKGRAIEKVTELIDGRRREDEIVASLHGELSPIEVHYCLLRLEQEGYMIRRQEAMPQELEVFWSTAGLDADTGYQSYRSSTVSLQAVGDAPLPALEEALIAQGGSLAAQGDLHVVMTDSYLRPELEGINREMLGKKRTWLIVKPVGHTIWLGPLFHPDQTGCWQCLAERLRNLRPLYQLALQTFSEFRPLASPADTPKMVQRAAVSLAVMEVLRWHASREEHALSGKLRTLDIHTYETQVHHLTRRPQCKACGDPRTPPMRKPLLESRIPKFVSDGGYRTVRPEVTFERYAHHISPLTGIVKYIRPFPTQHPLVQAYSAGHNLRPVSEQTVDLPAYMRDQSAGKGRTGAQAKASALCEALERHSAIYQGNEYAIQTTLAELGDRGIHPNECMHFSETQYAMRDDWHRSCDHGFQRVPEPFDSNARMDWTPVWSLVRDDVRYLPTAYCYFNYTGPFASQCRADSNGNAAGNTLEEAILQGFLELVERDSVAMWWYNRASRPAVDLTSFRDDYFQDVVAYYRTLNRDVWVLDLTADLEIPTFAAISRRNDRHPEDIIFGFGAHLDAHLAVQRALTELNQLLPFVGQQKEDGSTDYLYDGELEMRWWQTARLSEASYLGPGEGPLRMAGDFVRPNHTDLLHAIQYCVDRVAEKGMDLVVLDQTRPDVGMPVAKVIVPEMRIFWRRLGPGRLYDVPVKLGWIEEPTPEDETNPFPFFL